MRSGPSLRSKRGTLAVLVLAGVIAVSLSASCQRGYSGPVEQIAFAAIPSGSGALVYIAQEEGFFTENGLSVEVKDFPTGVATVDALLKGEVQIAWSAEFPLVRRAFARDPISIIAASSKFSDQYLYGRKDRGVEKPTDLKGKKIGVPRNTISEFYLARFLELNGLNARDVTLLDVPPPQSMAAITGDTADAVVTWEPFSSQIRTQLAGRVTAWPVQSSQPGYGVMTVRNDWLAGHPETVRRFLESLARSEDYLVRSAEAARAIVQKRMGFEDSLMDMVWPVSEFALSLDQALVIAMEDEARWMIATGLTTEKRVPDFLEFVSEASLKAVKPGVVSIIR